MGKLKGSIVYLAGPMDYAEDLGIGWRREIIPYLRSMDMLVLDPTNKPVMYEELNEGHEDHDYRKDLKESGNFEEIHRLGKPIRAFDLRCCDKADCIIVYLDMNIRTTGTMEELFISNKSKKPVLVFCKQGRKNIPDYIYWTLHPRYIFEHMNDVIDYLHRVDKGEEIDNTRWHFFDWEKIIHGN